MAGNNSGNPATASEETKGWLKKNLVWLVLIIALVASNLGVFYYQKSKNSTQKEHFNELLTVQKDMSTGLIEARDRQELNAIAKPMVEVVRAELFAGQMSSLDNFIIEMVQETNLDLVAIVDSVGSIALATDKKYEGKGILEVIPRVPSRVESPETVQNGPNEYIYAAPIRFGQRRAATLVMTYTTDKFSTDHLKAVEELNMDSEVPSE